MRKFTVTLESINHFRTNVRGGDNTLEAEDLLSFAKGYALAAADKDIGEDGICSTTASLMHATAPAVEYRACSYAQTEAMFWHVTGEFQVFPLKREDQAARAEIRPVWARAFSEALLTGVLEVTPEMEQSLKSPVSAKFEIK